MVALTTCPRISSGTPVMAHSTTAMGHQRTLYLKRADAVARRLDDIVLAADKPVIAVLVAPCHVARVVNSVVPDFAREFVVQVVLLEQPQRFSLVGADYDLPLFAVLGRRPSGVSRSISYWGLGTPMLPGFGYIHGNVASVSVVRSARNPPSAGRPSAA